MLVGQTISHYRILGLIGAGGMGEVYKAEDTRLKRTVALKFLSAALMHDEEAKRRLIVEAQAASALDHPNICTIHEVDEAPDGRVFLAMAYYEGETLKQRIDRGAVPITEALDIIAQVARAMTAAHEAESSTATSSRPISFSALGSRRWTRARASSSSISALPRFRARRASRAPARRSGPSLTWRRNTLSAMPSTNAPTSGRGCRAFELLAGRLPFSGSNELALIRAIADDAPERITSVRRDLPAGVVAIVTRALQKEPKDRYPRAIELLQALEAERTRTRTAPMTAPATRRPSTVAGRFALYRGPCTVDRLCLWFLRPATRLPDPAQDAQRRQRHRAPLQSPTSRRTVAIVHQLAIDLGLRRV